MSTLTMKGADFNRIMRTCSKFVAKSERRPAMNQIKLEHAAGSGAVTAVGLDGFKLAKVVVPAFGDEAFDAVIPVTALTKSEEVDITDDGERITFEHVGLFTVAYKKCKTPFVNWMQIMPDRKSTYEISVNPRLLASALASIPSTIGVVRLKFGSDDQPILIEQNGSEDQMLVMTVRA